jgi:hypothetical protein
MAVGAAFILVSALPASAQELDARRYTNAPMGLDLLAAGYSNSSGNILLDGSIPIEELEADLDRVILRYTRTGVRVVYPLNRRQELMFDFSTGLATAFGADADIVSVAYQIMWGGKT